MTKQMSIKMPPSLREALDETGLPWSIELGAKHYHIRIAGRLATIWPRGNSHTKGRGTRNVVAQVRRVAAQLAQSRALEQQ